MTELLGYVAAVCMGISLGLIGAGGAIFTVPILVYLFGTEPLLATTYSLLIVGSTALIGSVSHLRLGNVQYPIALAFGLPSLGSLVITRKWIIPAIPDPLVQWSSGMITKSTALLVLFAVLMLMASFSMIRPVKEQANSGEPFRLPYFTLLLLGLAEGCLSGLVGVGGGFLIIPILVLLARLPMKQAVGTSLLIIAAKSLFGFFSDLQSGIAMNWTLAGHLMVLSAMGILTGAVISKEISNEKLKPAFGVFVFAMGIYILIRETLLK